MSLAPYVRILGRGPGRARSLDQNEAREAMEVILSGNAAPEAIGALLMLMRMKGETAAELAGFVQAARSHIKLSSLSPALDWPSYAAGRTRGLPWFLLSAKLVAQAGYPVLLHGWNSHQANHADVRDGCAALGVQIAPDLSTANKALSCAGITYLPLEVLSPPLFALLQLRNSLGLRSCINTVVRLLNPCATDASVQGVFHPVYREIQADASALLGQQSLSVIKGGGGEFERHPSKDVAAFGLRDGTAWQGKAVAQLDEIRRLASVEPDPSDLAALWAGHLDDPFAQAVVEGTAALALDTLGVAHPDSRARDLWTNRHRKKAA
ncbi:Glycosyl transferase family 3 [Sulfitobacter noctilucicola]|uniref:Anthranilate phosphoribosyltransferase n=1 Tax=Sulfitobacter noctilucicola TaxID=1342301 RepID=A0A7W6M8A7_9RHOB|nr:glycosyl transferase family protein [Sulfitobacter noctilucicola]KIN62197.1 Glycosyl transferase family 3 [Sulfitobacter noctilucicola]MBB4173286.1 anthranilate phosphoribosyltransferase [Sulfitobacter noctilucicola]